MFQRVCYRPMRNKWLNFLKELQFPSIPRFIDDIERLEDLFPVFIKKCIRHSLLVFPPKEPLYTIAMSFTFLGLAALGFETILKPQADGLKYLWEGGRQHLEQNRQICWWIISLRGSLAYHFCPDVLVGSIVGPNQNCPFFLLTLSCASMGKSTDNGGWGLRHLNFVFICRMATRLRMKLRIGLFFTVPKSFWGVDVQVLAEMFAQRWAVSLSQRLVTEAIGMQRQPLSNWIFLTKRNRLTTLEWSPTTMAVPFCFHVIVCLKLAAQRARPNLLNQTERDE